jgi:hypothetical protein
MSRLASSLKPLSSSVGLDSLSAPAVPAATSGVDGRIYVDGIEKPGSATLSLPQAADDGGDDELDDDEDEAEQEVEVHVEWPADLVARLPDDFALTLSASDLPEQKLTKDAGAAVDGDMVSFAFKWQGENKVVTLEATGNGRKICLWDGQVSGDLEVAVDWDQGLDPLLKPYEEVEIAGDPSGAGEIADDLRGHELPALLADLLA